MAVMTDAGLTHRAYRPKFLIVYAGELDGVRFDPSEEAEHESLLEKLDPQPADGVLESLRSALSLTYERYDSYSALPSRLVTIRHKLTTALLPLGPLLRALKLKPVGDDVSWRQDADDQIMHKFVFAPWKELRLKVADENRERKWLTELMESQPGDAPLIAAREVLSLTFTEAFTPLEHLRLLGRIRKCAAAALAPCNWCLEAIQIEPVALPTLLGHEFLEQDLSDQEASQQ